MRRGKRITRLDIFYFLLLIFFCERPGGTVHYQSHSRTIAETEPAPWVEPTRKIESKFLYLTDPTHLVGKVPSERSTSVKLLGAKSLLAPSDAVVICLRTLILLSYTGDAL